MKCGFRIAGGQRAGASGRRLIRDAAGGGKPGLARLGVLSAQSLLFCSYNTESCFLFCFLIFCF